MSIGRITTFSPRNKIDLEVKYLVFGFCKFIPNIPLDIIQLINFLYDDNYRFNPGYASKNLEFDANYKIVKKKPSRSNWWDDEDPALCIFGEVINDNKCNKFQIHIKCVRLIFAFRIGFITSSIQKSIKNWNDHLGENANKEHSVGIEICWDKEYLYLFDKNNYAKKLKQYKSSNKFNFNDIFILSFDFEWNLYSIYHNQNIVSILSLNDHKNIIPAFSFSHFPGEEIEIIKCSSS